eukprot:15440378-Alexandrium_andersonii.AAC.1
MHNHCLAMRHVAAGEELRGKSKGSHEHEHGDAVRDTFGYIGNQSAEKNMLQAERNELEGETNPHSKKPISEK